MSLSATKWDWSRQQSYDLLITFTTQSSNLLKLFQSYCYPHLLSLKGFSPWTNESVQSLECQIISCGLRICIEREIPRFGALEIRDDKICQFFQIVGFLETWRIGHNSPGTSVLIIKYIIQILILCILSLLSCYLFCYFKYFCILYHFCYFPIL